MPHLTYTDGQTQWWCLGECDQLAKHGPHSNVARCQQANLPQIDREGERLLGRGFLVRVDTHTCATLARENTGTYTNGVTNELGEHTDQAKHTQIGWTCCNQLFYIKAPYLPLTAYINYFMSCLSNSLLSLCSDQCII